MSNESIPEVPGGGALKYGIPPNLKSKEITEAISACNRRLHQEKRWDEMSLLRDANRENGMDARLAKIVAMRQFPPVSMSDCEPAEYPLWGYQIPESPRKEKAKVRAAVSQSLVAPAPQALPQFKAIEDAALEEQRLKGLLLKIDVGLENSPREMVRWVIEHVEVSLANVEPSEVPGRAALILLQECRRDASFRQDLLKKWLDKILPTKQQTEYEAQFADDGRTQLERIDSLLASEEPAENP